MAGASRARPSTERLAPCCPLKRHLSRQLLRFFRRPHRLGLQGGDVEVVLGGPGEVEGQERVEDDGGQGIVYHDRGAVGQGAALGGVLLLLGDKRIMPLLEDVWNQLSEEAQLEMTQANSGFMSEGIIDFWLGRLESGCSEVVFGSAVAAIARMPASAQALDVLDVERLLPAYAGGEPMKVLRRTSFADYLEAIRPRLKALEHNESEPKVIPRIFEIWENPEAFPGLVG